MVRLDYRWQTDSTDSDAVSEQADFVSRDREHILIARERKGKDREGKDGGKKSSVSDRDRASKEIRGETAGCEGEADGKFCSFRAVCSAGHLTQ